MKLKTLSALGFAALLGFSCTSNTSNYGKTYTKEEFQAKTKELYKDTEPFETTNNSNSLNASNEITFHKLNGVIKWETSGSEVFTRTLFKTLISYFLCDEGTPVFSTGTATSLYRYALNLDDVQTEGVAVNSDIITKTLLNVGLYYLNDEDAQFEKIVNFAKENILESDFLNITGLDLSYAIDGNKSTFYCVIPDLSKFEVNGTGIYSLLSIDEFTVSGSSENAITFGYDDESLAGLGYISKQISKNYFSIVKKDGTINYNITVNFEIDYSLAV